MASWIYLALALLGAVFTLSAILRARGLWIFTVPYFLAAWLTGELPLHHIALQTAATGVFAALGAFTAWPGRVGLAISFLSWAGLLGLYVQARRLPRRQWAELRAQGLDVAAGVSPLHGLRPFHMQRKGVKRVRDVAYGPSLPRDRGGRNLLDVILPSEPGEGRPVLVQIHGGAWVVGAKERQGQPLMHELAARGWICVAINYRLSPQATFPDHIVDVKRALEWVHRYIGEFGGDPDFIAITGGSAGAHLASLAALTPGDAFFQPGFEDADTRVSACVAFYGIYDFLDRAGLRGSLSSFTPFLARTVMKCGPGERPELWDAASPIAQVKEAAPPFLVVQGTHDSLVFDEEARMFVNALREKSREQVVYLEVPGAQHAFDLFHSQRSAWAVRSAVAFLEQAHGRFRADGVWDQRERSSGSASR